MFKIPLIQQLDTEDIDELLKNETDIFFQMEKLEIIQNSDKKDGLYAIFLTNTEIFFLDESKKKGFKIPDVKTVVCHAMQRSSDHSCLYFQLDRDNEDDEMFMGVNDIELEEEEEEEIENGNKQNSDINNNNNNNQGQRDSTIEFRIYPFDDNLLQGLYDAFCDIAVRNPDLDSEEGEMFQNEEEEEMEDN